MNISINHITPRRENNEVKSVTVHFTAHTADGLITLSGSVPIEDFADKVDFEGLEDDVRTELINRIMNGDVDTE